MKQRTKNRTPLETVSPLAAPYSLIIEPSSICNSKCNFCPTGDYSLMKSVGRTQEFMSMDLFHKIVNDISQLDEKIRVVVLQGDGEPLLHKDIVEMVRVLKNDYKCNHVELTTNAINLSPEISRGLLSVGLDKIKISVNGLNANDYKVNCGIDINFEQLKDNIRYMYEQSRTEGNCEIYVKSIDFLLKTDEQKSKFHEIFEPIASYCGIEHSLNWTANHIRDFSYENNKTTFDGHPIVAGEVCPYPLWFSYIGSNGNVGCCNNDWTHSTVYGNVNEKCYKDIWLGKELYDFRMMILDGKENSHTACGNCSYRKCSLDNIDNVVDIIKQKLTKCIGR